MRLPCAEGFTWWIVFLALTTFLWTIFYYLGLVMLGIVVTLIGRSQK